MWQDKVNGGYEALGGLFVLLNFIKVLKDKKVRGVSIVAVAFFTSWGYWNLYYYPHLDQWWSFVGGMGIVAMNTLWILAMLHYIKKERCKNGRKNGPGC